MLVWILLRDHFQRSKQKRLLRPKLAFVEYLLPHSRDELRWFTALSVTVLGGGLAELVVSSKGYTLDLADGGLRIAAGAGLAGALAGMLGVVAGFLTRNPTTAMVAIFGTWIGEKIVGGWLGAGGRFLPYTLVENVLGLPAALSFGAAAAALVAVTAALALVARRTVLPRDVT